MFVDGLCYVTWIVSLLRGINQKFRIIMAKLVNYCCPHCGISLQARSSSVDSITRCKNCGGKIHLKRNYIGCLILFSIVTVLFFFGRFIFKTTEAPTQKISKPITIHAENIAPITSPIKSQSPMIEPPKPIEKIVIDTEVANKIQEPIVEVDQPKIKSISPEEKIKAVRALKTANQLLIRGYPNTARKAFGEVVSKYPDTDAAKEAQKHIDEINEEQSKLD